MANIVEELTKIVGKEDLLLTLEERMCYGYDGTFRTHVPDFVARPVSTSEVQAIMRLAAKEGIAVIPRGAGTGLSGGSVPVQGGLVLDLTKMNNILEIDRENLIAVVEPGVITGDLHQAVEQYGLYYPPDPSSLKTCTIGGNIAEGAGGPRAVKYGVTRDYVLGLEVVTADGTLLHTGGRTVKNVTGYDLTRLLVGSEGTLGVITKAILRLVPKPAAKRTLLAVFPVLDDAARTVSLIMSHGIVPASLELMDDVTIKCVENYLHIGLPTDVEAILLIEIDGEPEILTRQTALISDFCRDAGAREIKAAQNAREAEELWRARRAVSPAIVQLKPTKISEDATVPRTRIPEMIRRLKGIAAKYNLQMAIFGHAGDGNLHPNILADRRDQEEMTRVEKAVAELFAVTIELGGTLSGEHGIGLMKAPFMKIEFRAEELRYYQAVKQAFDPQNILNPGKIFGGEASNG